MGRPRKDSNTPQASERIISAFWELLEENRVKEITISMVAAKAGCNRGTFYYHFADMDELLYRAIESELLTNGEHSFALTMFTFLTQPSGELLVGLAQRKSARRICLMIEQGGMETIDSKMKAIIYGMWRDVLCEDGRDLTFESKLLIEYSVSGMISLFNLFIRMYRNGEELPKHIDVDGLQAIGKVQMARLAQNEGVEPSEMLLRLRMYDKFLKSKHQTNR